jgi:hypothetical protein
MHALLGPQLWRANDKSRHSLDVTTLFHHILDKPFPHTFSLAHDFAAGLPELRGIDTGLAVVLESQLVTSILPITTLLVLDHHLYIDTPLACSSAGSTAGQCAAFSHLFLYPPPARFLINGQMAERSKAPA